MRLFALEPKPFFILWQAHNSKMWPQNLLLQIPFFLSSCEGCFFACGTCRMYWHVANSFELLWWGCSHLAGKGFPVSYHSLRIQPLNSLVSLLVGLWFVTLHSFSRVPTLFVLQCPVNIEEWDFPLFTVIYSSNSEASFHLLFTVDTSYSRHFPSDCWHWSHYFL